MVKQFTRVFCLLCLATFAGASRGGEGGVPSNGPRTMDAPAGRDRLRPALVLSDVRRSPSAHTAAGRQNPDGEGVWSEIAQMALFGAGLSYLGLRLGKRKA
jgi:hypothetical protein